SCFLQLPMISSNEKARQYFIYCIMIIFLVGLSEIVNINNRSSRFGSVVKTQYQLREFCVGRNSGYRAEIKYKFFPCTRSRKGGFEHCNSIGYRTFFKLYIQFFANQRGVRIVSKHAYFLTSCHVNCVDGAISSAPALITTGKLANLCGHV